MDYGETGSSTLLSAPLKMYCMIMQCDITSGYQGDWAVSVCACTGSQCVAL